MYKMGKKGSIEIASEWIVHLALLLMVIILFVGFAYKIMNNNLHNLRVEVKDFAFTEDAIPIIPNSVDYNYKIRENITLSFDDKCIIQAKYPGSLNPPITFFCGLDKSQKYNQEIKEDTIRITK